MDRDAAAREPRHGRHGRRPRRPPRPVRCGRGDAHRDLGQVPARRGVRRAAVLPASRPWRSGPTPSTGSLSPSPGLSPRGPRHEHRERHRAGPDGTGRRVVHRLCGRPRRRDCQPDQGRGPGHGPRPGHGAGTVGDPRPAPGAGRVARGRDRRPAQPPSSRPHRQHRPVPGGVGARLPGGLHARRVGRPGGRRCPAHAGGAAAGDARPHPAGPHGAGRHARPGHRPHPPVVVGRRSRPTTRSRPTATCYGSSASGCSRWPTSSSRATAPRSRPASPRRASGPVARRGRATMRQCPT